MKIQDAELKIS